MTQNGEVPSSPGSRQPAGRAPLCRQCEYFAGICRLWGERSAGRLFAAVLACAVTALTIGGRVPDVVAAEPRQSAETFLEQGKEELKQKHYEQAVRLFSEAVRKDPEQAQAFKLRGQVYERLGRTQLAVKDYDRYLAMRPSDPDGYFRRADLLNRTLDHESAIRDYTRGLKLKPMAVEALVGRGLALVALERYPEALEDYRRALEIEPADAEVMGNMAIAYLLSGNSGKAAHYLKKALQHEQDSEWKTRLESWLEHVERRPRAKSPVVSPADTPPTERKPLW
ncbi:MAG: tetratricopeptide repeat protein [Thermodesulfobacteriota bacterium]